MNGIILRTLIIMLGLFLASSIIPGVQITGTGNFILAAILLGLVNAFIRPIALFLTLPITIVTLGLFLFVLQLLSRQAKLRREVDHLLRERGR